MAELPSPQGNIFSNIKNFYHKYSKILLINRVLKYLVNFSVNIFARLKKMEFPSKYPWDWKLEMLMYKFESETVAVFKRIIKPGMMVLDIGGHIGYYTRLFSKLVGERGKVYVFEPSPDNLKLLEYNIKKCKNVTLIKKAVCDKDGFVDFHRTLTHSASHSILEPDFASETISVPCITIDTFVKENNLNIDAIKLDVEGAEPLVLKGAEQIIKNIANLSVVMEFIESYAKKGGQTPKEHFQYLQNLGLTVYTILPDGTTKLFDVESYNWQDLAQGKFVINLFLKK